MHTAYLDVGCGSGMAARLAADLDATVAGIDAAEPLLAIARRRTPEGDFRVGDFQALPFADASFDLVSGFNAFQYAGNPVAALVEARRVTKSGGTIAIMVWGEPADMPMASVIAALGKLLPPAPPGAAGPFALSDASALQDFARQAGLEPVEMSDVDAPIRYPDLATALRGLNSSGVAARYCTGGRGGGQPRAYRGIVCVCTADGGYVIGSDFRCLLCRPGGFSM